MTINSGTVTPPASHVTFRRQTWGFIQSDADPTFRRALFRLRAHWEECNHRFFDSALTAPRIELAEPGTTRALGDTSTRDGVGCALRIRLRPSLLSGRYKHLRSGAEFAEGRWLFLLDVLLHEMIHQEQIEVTDRVEDSYDGHGPAFRDRANAIGAQLGLPKVRTCKKRGKDVELPSCAHWPHNVRPEDYYEGAYIPVDDDEATGPAGGDEDHDDEDDFSFEDDRVGRAIALLRALSESELARVLEAVGDPRLGVGAGGDR